MEVFYFHGHRDQLAFEFRNEARYDGFIIYLLHAMLVNVASMHHFWLQRLEKIEHPPCRVHPVLILCALRDEEMRRQPKFPTSLSN